MVAGLINESYTVVKILTSRIRALDDEVYRIRRCVFCLEDIFLCSSAHIEIITELCLVVRKGDKRICKRRSDKSAMLRAIRSHCSECI